MAVRNKISKLAQKGSCGVTDPLLEFWDPQYIGDGLSYKLQIRHRDGAE